MTEEKEIKAVVALFIKDNKILSVSRRYKPDNLGLAGGKIDPGETPQQALLREIKEEVGPDIQVKKMELCFERIDDAYDNICQCFLITEWSGDPKQSEDGISVSWAEPKQFIASCCSFREYNLALFEKLGIEWQ